LLSMPAASATAKMSFSVKLVLVRL
jgi:hypothetical protein